MWRSIACAGGLVVACAASYGLYTLNREAPQATNFDLRWLYPTSKADRLPMSLAPRTGAVTMAFHVPSANTTIAAKSTAQRIQESAVQMNRVRVRTERVGPVRTVPNDEKPKDVKKDKLPVGCESAFSPVTSPALAHISGRCDA